MPTTLTVPAPDERRCTATSTRSHVRCQKYAIAGANVCYTHGGNAPQVRRKAAERLALMMDPSLTKVAERIKEGLDAMESKFFAKDGEVITTKEVVAWGERRQYAGLAMEAAGIVKAKEEPVPQAVQVNITTLGA